MLITALATPLSEENHLDMKSFHRLLQHQKKGGIDGVIVAGTTGQGSLLSLQEKGQLLQATLDYPFNRGLCISDVSIARVFDNMEIAAKHGAQFLLVTPPFFVKPTQEAIYQFFQKILDQSSCPVILYNNPSRIGVGIDNGVYSALKGHPRLWGTKESAGKESLAGIEIPVFCGDDENIESYKQQGAVGAISVISNLFVNLAIKTVPVHAVNPLPIQYLLQLAKIFTFSHLRQEIGSLTSAQQKIIEDLWVESMSAF